MSDFDGDISFTTDNPIIYNKKIHTGVPITYKKNVIKKSFLNPKDFYKADIDSFNSTIGQITNYSTSDYDLINKYKMSIQKFFGEKDMDKCREIMEAEKNTNTKWSDDFKKVIYNFECYDELIERLKLTRKAQGDSIDFEKSRII